MYFFGALSQIMRHTKSNYHDIVKGEKMSLKYLRAVSKFIRNAEELQKTHDMLIDRICELKVQSKLKQALAPLSIIKNAKKNTNLPVTLITLKDINIDLVPEYRFNIEGETSLIVNAFHDDGDDYKKLGFFTIEATSLVGFSSVEDKNVEFKRIHIAEVDEYSSTYDDIVECICYLFFKVSSLR